MTVWPKSGRCHLGFLTCEVEIIMGPTSEGLCFYLKTAPETKNWVLVASRGGDLRKQEEAAERRKAMGCCAAGACGAA